MLPEELMRQVRQLQILTRRAVNEDFAGEYSSAFKGRGMEFAEVREYQPGDDVRTIDWNVTARTGTPFVKKFIEERELTIIFAVDLSGSGQFGSVDRFKNRTAAELCAVLAFAAIANNDKAGLLIFTDHVEHFIPPKKGSRHVQRLIRELLDFTPKRRGTDIAGTLEYLGRVLKRKAVVFVVSDFLAPLDETKRNGHTNGHLNGHSNGHTNGRLSSDFDTALRLLNRRHDVIAVRISDQLEHRLPAAGLLEFEDAETGERFFFDAGSRRARREYERTTHESDRALIERFRRHGIDAVEVQTGEPFIRTLMQLFRRRERRR